MRYDPCARDATTDRWRAVLTSSYYSVYLAWEIVKDTDE